MNIVNARIYSHFIMILMIILFAGCSEDMLKSVEQEIDQEINSNVSMMTLTLGLPDDEVKTRLSYTDASSQGKLKMVTKWSEDDKILVTLSPGNPAGNGVSSVLELLSGAGTSTGVFTGEEINYISKDWFFYFPAGKVGGEKDYLAFSYLGQVQDGNNNLDHLKEYHTLRTIFSFEEYVNLDGNDVDFSGENIEQSGCIKFNLTGLPSIVPVNISLECYDGAGSQQSVFYAHNYLNSYYPDNNYSYSPNSQKVAAMGLKLENFEQTSSVTAYLMVSNAPVEIAEGSKLRVVVTDSEGSKYYCDKPLASKITLKGGTLNRISCSAWEELQVSDYDGMENPASGVVVLQENSVGEGVDIILMGDGYAEDKFGKNGQYDADMRQAYSDFFSAEPFKSLKPYFNVYYINAVSQENHDAEPMANGAVQGDAVTVFNTQFVENTTRISGNDELTLQYAMQAIRAKGGNNGTQCTDEDEIYARAYRALVMVMVNVPCHAGTCYMRWTIDSDYGNAYSVAYTSLNTSDFARKWTMLHESGGHGFGKLADEYVNYVFTQFPTHLWKDLDEKHSYGVNRNVDRYWGASYPGDAIVVWDGVTEAENVVTTTSNVYWSDLVTDYSASEGLGVWESANTYSNFYCRATDNSVMNNQFAQNGQFFNAIQRWAIWYRVMRLAGVNVGSNFKSSLSQFKNFDKNLTIPMNESTVAVSATRQITPLIEEMPLAPPVLIKSRWENGRLVEE